MDTNRILAELRTERSRIESAIAAIEGLNSIGNRRGRRPAAVTSRKKGGRRGMSAAARRKMSRRMKERWAEAKRRGKAAL